MDGRLGWSLRLQTPQASGINGFIICQIAEPSLVRNRLVIMVVGFSMDSKYSISTKNGGSIFATPRQKSEVPFLSSFLRPSAGFQSALSSSSPAFSPSSFSETSPVVSVSLQRYGCPPDLRYSRWRLLPRLYPSPLSFTNGAGEDRSLHVQAPYLSILPPPSSTAGPLDPK